ncbi:MAG: hypothetical protein EPN91_02990 [Salinibacterium sp.]|nr:MAG: hypothetical protein EPN91_02990 [Salinibacterium sp.]
MRVEEVLAQEHWAIGYCRAGEASGSYILFWPLGSTGLWEVDFAPFHGFFEMTDEDTFVFSRDDKNAAENLERCDIEWPVSIHDAWIAERKYFPESRLAHGENFGEPFVPPEPALIDRQPGEVDPWGE